MSGKYRGRTGVRWLVGGHRAVRLVVAMVLVLDAVLAAIHLEAVVRGSGNVLLYLDADRSYGEFFQYLKFVWLLLLVALYAVEQRTWQIAMWLPAFAYFLADDSLQLHETWGGRLVEILRIDGVLGLRAQDLGEHLVSGLAGLALLLPLVLAYVHSDERTRWIHRGFLVLVGLLLFFGVVLDSIHVVVIDEPRTGDWMGFIEDGGEMFAVTLMVAFAVRINLSGGAPGFEESGTDDAGGLATGRGPRQHHGALRAGNGLSRRHAESRESAT